METPHQENIPEKEPTTSELVSEFSRRKSELVRLIEQKQISHEEFHRQKEELRREANVAIDRCGCENPYSGKLCKNCQEIHIIAVKRDTSGEMWDSESPPEGPVTPPDRRSEAQKAFDPSPRLRRDSM
jgi:hypothetical protein